MSTLKVNRFENTSGIAFGTVLQVVHSSTSAVSTTATAFPHDNTIPQSGEGAEVLTATITPKSATNKLKITMVLLCSNSAAGNGNGMGLFQDSTADALAATCSISSGNGAYEVLTLVHYMTAGTTSSTTFKMRAGGSAGTMTINGSAGTRVFGGAASSSITIEEIQV